MPDAWMPEAMEARRNVRRRSGRNRSRGCQVNPVGYIIARAMMPTLFTRSKCPDCGKCHAPIEEHGKPSRKEAGGDD